MALLLDTHILVWIGTADPRLSRTVASAIVAVNAHLFVSAVTLYELEDLRLRGRLGTIDRIGRLIEQIDAIVLDFPAEAYRIIPLLPHLHRDPVDRMLIAHALHADLTLVTADATIRDYPVRTLW